MNSACIFLTNFCCRLQVTDMTDIARFISGMPKAELHLHIEGTLEPELMMELAQRNNVALPYKTADEARAAYQFSCLQDFLDVSPGSRHVSSFDGHC